MSDISQFADHAAAASDRWLFLFTLIILGVFAIYVMKYFMSQYEALIADHKEARKTYQDSLIHIVSQQTDSMTSMSEVLAKNSEIIRQNSEALRDYTDAMKVR